MGGGGRVAGRTARGDVFLYRFAAPDKLRPVVVLTHTDAIPYLSRVTVAPISTKVRGVPSEVGLSEEDGMQGICAVNLHAIVTVSQHLLGARLARLSPSRMAKICTALLQCLGCEPN